jgi:hypothetical protein
MVSSASLSKRKDGADWGDNQKRMLPDLQRVSDEVHPAHHSGYL